MTDVDDAIRLVSQDCMVGAFMYTITIHGRHYHQFERHTFTDDSVVRAAEHRLRTAVSARGDVDATTDTRVGR